MTQFCREILDSEEEVLPKRLQTNVVNYVPEFFPIKAWIGEIAQTHQSSRKCCTIVHHERLLRDCDKPGKCLIISLLIFLYDNVGK